MLFVCTANTGRSALAEALLRSHLLEREVVAEVGSAGHRTDGETVSPLVARAARHHGGQLAGHRSRRLTAELLQDADLVVAMTHEHSDAAAGLLPAAADRTFLLRDLLRRVRVVGSRAAQEPLPAYLARLRAVPALDGDLDVADPYGQPPEVLAATAAELDELLGELTEVVWPRGQHRRS